jgi:TonB family protein
MNSALKEALLFALVLHCGAPRAARSSPMPGTSAVTTQLIALVGFPAKDQPSAGSAVLIPGNVIVLDPVIAGSRQASLEQSLSHARVIENLWSTFRLDPLRQNEKNVTTTLLPGKSIEIQPIESAPIKIIATLLSVDEKMSTYRVLMMVGEKPLADSTANIPLGSRAVFGGKDGDAAPYVFLIVQPAAVKGPDLAGITPPRKIQSSLPTYPESAKKEKITGLVVLETVIDENGKATSIEVLESPDPRLSEAAASALRQWLFEPARKQDGRPVAARVSIEFIFKLQ